MSENGGADVIQFRSTRGQPPKIRQIAQTHARKLSNPISVSLPRKEGEPCAFRKGCSRVCAKAKPYMHKPEADRLLGKELEEGIEEFHAHQDAHLEQKLVLAEYLARLMEGSISLEKGKNPKYERCDAKEEGFTAPRKTQVYSFSQVKEKMKYLQLQLNLGGCFVKGRKELPPSGLHRTFAMLLSRMSAMELPEKTDALRMLINNGGLNGMRELSAMAAEPWIPPIARKRFVQALGYLASSKLFTNDAVIIWEGDEWNFLRSISRFHPNEELFSFPSGESSLGMNISGQDAPLLPAEPPLELSRIRLMRMCAVQELFQAIMNLSGRLDELNSAARAGREHPGLAQDLYWALIEAIGSLAGNQHTNNELVLEFLERKGMQISQWKMDPGEQVMVRHAGWILLDNGLLDEEPAMEMLGMLNAVPDDRIAESYMERMGIVEFEAGAQS